MHIRKYDRNSDYDTLTEWWTQWEFGVVPKEILPVDGIMVINDDRPVCYAGMYLYPNTAFGLMEWVVTDKDSNIRDRGLGIKYLKPNKSHELYE